MYGLETKKAYEKQCDILFLKQHCVLVQEMYWKDVTL